MSLIKNYEFIRDWVNHRLATDLQNYYTSSQVDTAIGNVSSSLSNYDTSTQVDTKIANAIAGVTQFDYEIVQALPASGVKGKIYLLPNNQSGQNVYDEYLYIGGNWEKLGPQIDLSDYVTVSDYEEDEEVISAALNDLNTRIKSIEDADYDSQIAAAGQIDSVTFNGVPATINNKVAAITVDIPDISGKEDTSNKVTSLSYSSTNTQYPSAKAVYDFSSDIVLQSTHNTWESANDSDFYLPTGTYSKIIETLYNGGYIPRIILRREVSGAMYENYIFQPVVKVDDPDAIRYCCHYERGIDYYIQYTSDTTIESRWMVNNRPTSIISSSSTNTQSPSALAVYNYIEDKLSDIEAVLDEIITPTPILQASAESLTFECVAGSTQALTFTVGGNYLRGNINIAETDASNVFTLNPTAGNNKITKANGEANTTVVTVTFAPSTAGQYTGSMTFSSTGAEPLTITFSATATAA